MNRTARTILVYLAVIFVVVVAVNVFVNQSNEPTEFTLGEFNDRLEAGDIESPVLMKAKSDEIEGTYRDPIRRRRRRIFVSATPARPKTS